jgi:mono/diheme cytochrome c family protein
MTAPLALLAALALASDPAAGERAFSRACSQCHLATPAPPDGRRHEKKEGELAPDLVRVVQERSAAELRDWTRNPWAKKKDTACDPRGVSAAEVEDLVGWLLGIARPQPPPEPERLKKAVERSLEERAGKPPRTPRVKAPRGAPAKGVSP